MGKVKKNGRVHWIRRSACLAGCFFFMSCYCLAMSSAEAVQTLLNSQNAVGAKTYAEAWRIVEREAKEGKALQRFVIGLKTDDKELSKKYLAASRERIRALAEKKDNPLAWYLLSMENNDFVMLRKAVEGGNVQALNALGAILTQQALSGGCHSSNGVERILRQSYELFRKAAAQCDPNGFINLGTCYLRGYGCERDVGMAFACFKAAADAGHPEGMDNVSACYQFGHGVAKDAELSLLWAMRGRAARGDEAAMQWLRRRK